MDRFPLCKKLGLSVWGDDENGFVIEANDLEVILKDAIDVYSITSDGCFSATRIADDQYKAKLVLIKPLKDKTKNEMALELLEKLALEGNSDAKKITEMKN